MTGIWRWWRTESYSQSIINKHGLSSTCRQVIINLKDQSPPTLTVLEPHRSSHLTSEEGGNGRSTPQIQWCLALVNEKQQGQRGRPASTAWASSSKGIQSITNLSKSTQFEKNRIVHTVRNIYSGRMTLYREQRTTTHIMNLSHDERRRPTLANSAEDKSS